MARYYFTHDNGGYELMNFETAFLHIGACSNLSVRANDDNESVEITDISWRKWAPILYETSADDIYVTDTSAGYDQDVLSYSQLCAYLHSIIVSSGGSGSSAVWGQITGTLSQQTDLKNALDAKQGTLEAGTGITIEGNVISATGGGGGSTTWGSITGTLSSQTDLKNALDAKQDSLTFDNSPTSGSNNPVKSGGVYTALSGKQNTLTFDNSPTENSDNPVKSGGIYTALAGKADASTVRFVIHAEYNVGTGAVTLASTTTQAALMAALTAKKAMDIDFTVSGTYYRNPMLSFYEDGTGAHEVRFRNDAMGFDVVLSANTTSNTYAFEVRQFVMTESAYGNLQSVDPTLIYYLTADPQS